MRITLRQGIASARTARVMCADFVEAVERLIVVISFSADVFDSIYCYWRADVYWIVSSWYGGCGIGHDRNAI